MRIQTETGERVLTYGNTSERHFPYAVILLYNANSTFVLRITAVTEDNRTITSNDVMITEDELHGYMSNESNGKLVTMKVLKTIRNIVRHMHR